MKNISTFRGLAGEVVAQFIGIGTLFSAIPVLLYYGLLTLVMGFLMPEEAFPFDILLMIVLSTLPVARFAIPAAKGKLDQGWFSEHVDSTETIAFISRYAVLTLMWVIPVGTILWLLNSTTSTLPMGGNPFSLMQSGITGLVLFILLVVSIIAPTLGYVICTAANSIQGVVGITPWKELITEHRGDIAVFYAALFGGIAVFWLVYAIPMAIITAILFAISPALGVSSMAFIVALPAAMTPILIGRLAGVFVNGSNHQVDEEDNGEDESNAPATAPEAVSTSGSKSVSTTALNVDTILPSSDMKNTAPAAPPPDLSATSGRSPTYDAHVVPKLLQKVKNTAPHQVNNAILMANNRYNVRRDDPLICAEVALLYCKIKRFAAAREWVELAIPLCLAQRHFSLAAKLFVEVISERNNLSLSPETWQALAEILLGHNQFQMAIWSLHKGMVAAECPPQEIQQQIIAIAEKAKKEGKTKGALTSYILYLKLFKESDFHEMVQKEIEQLK